MDMGVRIGCAHCVVCVRSVLSVLSEGGGGLLVEVLTCVLTLTWPGCRGWRLLRTIRTAAR